MALSYNTKMLNLKKKISEDKKNLRSIILEQDRDIKKLLTRSKEKNQLIANAARELKDLETKLKDAHEVEIMFKLIFFVVGLIFGVVLGCLL